MRRLSARGFSPASRRRCSSMAFRFMCPTAATCLKWLTPERDNVSRALHSLAEPHRCREQTPNWLFGPVWTVLYAMMGVAAWRVWCKAWGNRARRPLALFALQLALNLGWSVTFFGLHAIGAAVVVIVALEAAILGTMLAFRRIDGVAAALLVPYALWVAFATLLNVTIWRLNN